MSQSVETEPAGEWIFARAMTPEQELAWMERKRLERDNAVHFARFASRMGVKYAKWAAEETNPARASYYIIEARRIRDRGWAHLDMARRCNVS